MLGIIAAVLIVLWLLGFFAFHVTTGFIHIVLVLGIVLLVFHLLRVDSIEIRRTRRGSDLACGGVAATNTTT